MGLFASLCLSFCMEQLAPYWTEFHEVLVVLLESFQKMHV